MHVGFRGVGRGAEFGHEERGAVVVGAEGAVVHAVGGRVSRGQVSRSGGGNAY